MVLQEKVRAAIHRPKTGKSFNIDNIPAELWKYGGTKTETMTTLPKDKDYKTVTE